MIRTLIVGDHVSQLFENLSVSMNSQNIGISCRYVGDAASFGDTLAAWRPHVILSFFPDGATSILDAQSWSVRRRWVNYPFGFSTREHAIGAIMSMYSRVVMDDTPKRQQLVSVVTPTHNIGSMILRAYDSLSSQTYGEWEWVLYDDSTDEETAGILKSIARSDHRVRVHRGGDHSGVVGEVKRRGFSLAEGDIILELDHDDELIETCIEQVVAGFSANPECGFAYTDCAEVESDGSPVRYGENFAFGFGTYRNQMCEYRGKSYLVANNPPINTKTLSHIVGMPNHARAWTRSAYMDIGGHSADLGVADDYELLLRTFLKTRMLHVKHFGYVQHRRPGRVNTHLVRNREIQGQVAVLSRAYASAVQRRARELVGDAVQDVEFVSLNLDFQMNTQSIEGTKANE